MGSCHCNLWPSKGDSKLDKQLSKQISSQYSKLKVPGTDSFTATDSNGNKIKVPNTESFTLNLTPGNDKDEFVSVTSYDDDTNDNDKEQSLTPKYEISVTGASYDNDQTQTQNNHNQKPSALKLNADDVNINEADMTTTEIILDDNKLDVVNSFVPSEDQTPVALGNTAPLEPFNSNEAWDQPYDNSNDVELSEIQEAMDVMERRLSQSADIADIIKTPRPRRGSHLLQPKSVNEWTQDDLEESTNLMERQMSYLRHQINHDLPKENTTTDDPVSKDDGDRDNRDNKDIAIVSEAWVDEDDDEDEDDSISDLEDATPRSATIDKNNKDKEEEEEEEVSEQRNDA